MTTTTFTVEIPVTTYYVVEVTRPANSDAETIADSITEAELAEGEIGSIGWDEVKDAWRGDAEDWNITDENGDDVE